MSKDLATRMYTGGTTAAARYGIALASAFAFTISGCDSSGPDIAKQPPGSDDLSEPGIAYREGGVVLSKSASDELADFVAATQFDAVLPMSVRLHSMARSDRGRFLKRLDAARQEVETASARVENGGDKVSRSDLARLDAANRKIENIMRTVLKKPEHQRSRDRAAALVEKYPILKELSHNQIKQLLLEASVSRSTVGAGEVGLFKVQGDTGQGDTCKWDCTLEYVTDFAVTEIAFGGALFGCAFTGPGYFGCVGWALAGQWVKLASDTITYYNCTKRCT